MTSEVEKVETAFPQFDTLIADIPGSSANLGMVERSIFWMLHNAKGRIVTHRTIWDTLYGDRPESKWPSLEVVKVHISHIRRKLPGWTINNHHGIGYSMTKREA